MPAASPPPRRPVPHRVAQRTTARQAAHHTGDHAVARSDTADHGDLDRREILVAVPCDQQSAFGTEGEDDDLADPPVDDFPSRSHLVVDRKQLPPRPVPEFANARFDEKHTTPKLSQGRTGRIHDHSRTELAYDVRHLLVEIGGHTRWQTSAHHHIVGA